MRGGIVVGLTGDGREVPIAATPDNELKVHNPVDDDIDRQQLLELRAIRIGLALLLKIKPEDLLKQAVNQ